MTRPFLMLLLALPLVCSGGAIAQDKPADGAGPNGGKDYYIFGSKFYRVLADIPREDADRIAEHMDTTFTAYNRRFVGFPNRHRGKMDLYLFKTRERFLRGLAKRNINGTGSAGMFIGDAVVTHVSGRNTASVLSTLRHEGFHQFAAFRVTPDLDPWLNEGMAEYFADGVVGRNDVYTGLVTLPRLTTIRALIETDRTEPLDRLVSIRRGEWNRDVREHRSGPRYIQSWSVVHFLLHGEDERYAPALRKYLLLRAKEKPADKAWAEAFADHPIAQIEASWKTYWTKRAVVSPELRVLQELNSLVAALGRLDAGAYPATLGQMYTTFEHRKIPHVPRDRSVFAADDDQPVAKLLFTPGRTEKLPPVLRVRGPGKLLATINWRLSPEGEAESELWFK